MTKLARRKYGNPQVYQGHPVGRGDNGHYARARDEKGIRGIIC